ncbi:MAG: DNA repair protein RecO [Armatimonadetes bacterium]|nr:DNA repair protein RecO [Armatimonadota bacterium]
MSEISAEGVVLRRWDSGESDRRIALLTRERGKIYAIARGARKANARLAGVSEPLMHVQFGLALGRKNRYVTQAQPLDAFPRLRYDYQKLVCALVFVEVVDAVLPLEEPQPEVFDLCLTALRGIEIAREPLGALAWADIRLMDLAGFRPEFSVSAVSQKAPGSVCFLSPSAGGVVLPEEVADVRDAKETPREIVVTLGKLQTLESPPEFIKRAEETARAIYRFWSEIAGRELPARKRLLP